MSTAPPTHRPQREQPLRIAVVTETYPPEVNGVARTIAAMIDLLCQRGHSVQLVRPRQDADTLSHDASIGTRGVETVLRSGMRLPRYPGLRLGFPAKRALLRMWRERRPDVVQVVTEGPLGASAIAAAERLGIPLVSEFHTNFDSYSRHYGFGLLSGVVANYLRRLHSRAAVTLVPTEDTRARLAAAGYPRVVVVGRGVDTESFGPQHRSGELRRSWSAGERDLVALYVGRVAPEKNLELFAHAVDAMRAIAPSTRVVIVGDGPATAALQDRHRDYHFAGVRRGADLAAHYASADVFLFPSLTETFGNVTTEALASALAVVAYDYAAARQHIRHGESGLLARTNEPGHFVELVCEVTADSRLRSRLREGALRAVGALSWDQVIDELEAVLRGVIARLHFGRVVTGSRALHSA
jgi:glycosyltransferase involved in cell wall biosynthesis